jgi:hypothetical protein
MSVGGRRSRGLAFGGDDLSALWVRGENNVNTLETLDAH